MRKLTVEVPTPKFEKGQVIELPNKTNSKSVYLLVGSVELNGEWVECNNETAIRVNRQHLWGTVQEGSYYDCVELELMRPGTILSFGKGGFTSFDNYTDLENRGFVTIWNRSTISPDTPENSIERETKWNESKRRKQIVS